MVLLPEMSSLQNGISSFNTFDLNLNPPKEIGLLDQLQRYTSRKNPASLMHFTVAVPPRRSWRSSQWKNVARPPAEQPESST
jgi:hypothetical protein